MKERTRIRITYAFEDETGFQKPDLMITKEWYRPDNPDIVTFARALYTETIQNSLLYHEDELLVRDYKDEIEMIAFTI